MEVSTAVIMRGTTSLAGIRALTRAGRMGKVEEPGQTSIMAVPNHGKEVKGALDQAGRE